MTLNDAEAERLASLASLMGKKGGSARGPRKARGPDHYRRIAKLGAAKKAANAKAKKGAK